MKNFFYGLLAMLVLSSCMAEKTTLNIPANNSIEINYVEYNAFRATLKNRSLKDLKITVESIANNEQIKGFGLAPKGKAAILVESENKLVIQNQSNTPVSLKLHVQEENPKENKTKVEYVSFTLKNTGAKSIPLIIPTVMNPNLSPFSKSGVKLKIGQEILFKSGVKRFVLLTVDESIKDGDELDITKLLKKRKEELGIK